MDEEERVPIDEDGNEILPRGRPGWTKPKHPLAKRFLLERRPRTGAFQTEREARAWGEVARALEKGDVNRAWVEHCHEEGMKLVPLRSSPGTMVPRWGWILFCRQASNKEKFREWQIATRRQRSTNPDPISGVVGESGDEHTEGSVVRPSLPRM